MGECCDKKNNKQVESTAKKLVNDLKSSIFCGTKGFLTFNLAFLSWLDYSSRHNTKLKAGAAFAMQRNTLPFLEMIIIPLLVYFALLATASSISLMQCVLACAVLMIAACFVVRAFHLREKLTEKITNYSRKEIDGEFEKDTIKFPIFDQNRKHIEYNSPNQEKLPNETSRLSFLAILLFPLNVLLKALQSCIMLSLAAVELLEAVPSFCVDVVFDRSFASTKSNLQKSGHLLYASVRNLVPISILDKSVAELIGTPKTTCCGGR